ncbi:hypothetical protein ACFFF7_06935 [Novosphingobium aquiterrae]|uniref:Uncharacterized protein n=1 Tax=Novosphingobium aquiterrae TaxID=624388 RepID=A0ABV6PH52_9SPHN
MNAPTSLLIPEQIDIEEFNQLRLKTLDAFYTLDVALEDWLHDIGSKCPTASTGCRINALATAQFPANVASKAQADYLSGLNSELSSAIEVRNLVVHSRASFGYVGDRPTIFLKPVGFKFASSNGYLHFELQDIELAIKVASSAAAKISAWRKQRDAKQASA